MLKDRPRANFYENRNLVDPFPDPSLIDPYDEKQEQEIDQSIGVLINSAVDSGFPKEHLDELTNIIQSRQNVFRLSFSAGPPENVPPIRIQLRYDAVPTVVKMRRYSADQREFLRNLMDRLIKIDYVYPNPTAKWASAPHLVPKTGTVRWRFTGDLRTVKKWTIPQRLSLIHI